MSHLPVPNPDEAAERAALRRYVLMSDEQVAAASAPLAEPVDTDPAQAAAETAEDQHVARWRATSRSSEPLPRDEHRVKHVLDAGGGYRLACRDCAWTGHADNVRQAIVASAEHRAGAR